MIGFKPIISSTPLAELPGALSCSDKVLTRIWYAGARISQLKGELYVPKGALPFSNATAASGWAHKISPYSFGYRLKAVFM